MREFPIGIGKFAPAKTFSGKDLNKAKKEAVEYLDQIKEKYSVEHEEVKRIMKLPKEERIEIKLQNDNFLPEFISELHKGDKLIGYVVENFLDNNNKPYPKKEFTDSKNDLENKNNAIKYVDELKLKNKNALFDDQINDDPKRKNKLPTNIYYTVDDNNKPTGYLVKFEIAGKKIQRKYCNPKVSMEEKLKLKLAMKFVEDNKLDVKKQKEELKEGLNPKTGLPFNISNYTNETTGETAGYLVIFQLGKKKHVKRFIDKKRKLEDMLEEASAYAKAFREKLNSGEEIEGITVEAEIIKPQNENPEINNEEDVINPKTNLPYNVFKHTNLKTKEQIGYKVRFQVDGKEYAKKFGDPNKTFNELLEEAIAYAKEFRKKYNVK